MLPEDRVSWEFFRTEFRKKYISQRFLDKKRKEFLELKQEWRTMAEYEREFMRLSKYARECVSSEAAMCARFEDGLNEDIKLLVGILELKEFVILVDRASKVKELTIEKRKVERESCDFNKRPMGISFSSPMKKMKEFSSHMSNPSGISSRDRGKQGRSRP